MKTCPECKGLALSTKVPTTSAGVRLVGGSDASRGLGSLAAGKPWVAKGMSPTTWFRREAEKRNTNPGARMAFVCFWPLAENPWMEMPMNAVSRHLPPRPKPVLPPLEYSPSPIRSASLRFSPQPAGRRQGSTSLTSVWTSPLAEGWRGLVAQSSQIGVVNGCATSRRRSSQPASRPSARR
jgi:hypothetical protein